MHFDDSLRDKKHKSKNKDFNLTKRLIKNKKINQDFLNRIKSLTLEEIIYLKLDSIMTSLNGKFFGFPMVKVLPQICKEALITFALSVSKNRKEAALMLGLKRYQLTNFIKQYDINLSEGEKDAPNKKN